MASPKAPNEVNVWPGMCRGRRKVGERRSALLKSRFGAPSGGFDANALVRGLEKGEVGALDAALAGVDPWVARRRTCSPWPPRGLCRVR